MLFFWFHFAASAQTVYLTAHVGGGRTAFKTAPFDAFVDSYNDFYAANLETPFQRMNPSMLALSFGGGIQIGFEKSYFNFEFSKITYSQSIYSRFQNGFGREVNLKFKDWNFLFDNTFGSNKFKIGPLYGVGLRSGIIYSYSNWHTPENRSLGHEYWLNGIYRGIVQSDISLGVVARIQILKPLLLQMRAYHTFRFTMKEDYLSAFSDASPGKNPFSEYFPTDMQAFETNIVNASYDYENNVIPMGFRGIQLNVALIYRFKLGEE